MVVPNVFAELHMCVIGPTYSQAWITFFGDFLDKELVNLKGLIEPKGSASRGFARLRRRRLLWSIYEAFDVICLDAQRPSVQGKPFGRGDFGYREPRIWARADVAGKAAPRRQLYARRRSSGRLRWSTVVAADTD